MVIFPQHIPNDILYITGILNKKGFELYLVGGAVRNALMGFPSDDYDLATSAKPEEITALFQGKALVIPTGIKHGTVTLVIGGVHYEITSYRIDGVYSDARHPDTVSFTSSLTEDLARRDFTINAMAAHPVTKEIIDPFYGISDLSSKIIRTVGYPIERFHEDALRMLRACRFSAVLNFEIEEKTFEAISLLSSNIQAVSAERIREELMKMLKAPLPSKGLDAMRQTGLLEYILPELLEGYKIDQNEYHKYDVYTHNLKTCDFLTTGYPLTRWAALLHDIGKPRSKDYALKVGNGNVFYNHEAIGAKMSDRIMKRLKFSNEDRAWACLLVELHMFYYTSDWTDGAVRRFLRRFDGDKNFLNELFLLREADRKGSGTKKQAPKIFYEFRSRIDKVLAEDAALKVTDLNINGNIIMETFHIKPSPFVGTILHYLLELVLDEPSLNEEAVLLEKAALFITQEKPSGE